MLGERGWLREWRESLRWLSSELVRVECLRTLDRARIRHRLPDDAVARRRASLLDYLEGFEFIHVDRGILERAAEPFPTLVGTLHALHLASALAARSEVPDLVFATHDRELALAARAEGFPVVGVSVPP